jgi:hypothetical protein
MWMITNQVFDVIFISILNQFEKVQLDQLVQLVLMKTIWKKYGLYKQMDFDLYL